MKKSTLKGNMKATAFAGGMLAAGNTAHASIISYTLPTPVNVGMSGAHIYFSLTGTNVTTVNPGSSAYQFYLYAGGGAGPSIIGRSSAITGNVAQGVQDSAPYALKLSYSTQISAPIFTATGNAYIANGSIGYWAGSGTGYLGLSFLNSGTTDYGWAKISYNSSSQNLSLYSYAYDNSGAAIGAGQTCAVPEPSTLALMAMGAGSVAAFAARNKRAQNSRSV
jgi:hypothetical protein